jgi:hypothetical protein
MPTRFARWWQVRKGLNEFGIQSKKEQCTVAAPARNALRLADFRQITLVIPTTELTILWMNGAGSQGTSCLRLQVQV